MARIVGFTDLHLIPVNPSSRIDDYPAAMLGKVEQVISAAAAFRADAIVIGGDVTHSWRNMSWEYLNQVIRVLKSAPCDVWSIIGNHDCRFGNSDNIDQTPMGTLLASALRHLADGLIVEVGGAAIHGINFCARPEQRVPAAIPGVFNMLVAHAYWDGCMPFTTEETLRAGDVVGFDAVFLGHDHNPYPVKMIGNTALIRPGSLSRGTQTGSALSRSVYYFTLDTEAQRVQYMPLNVRPAEEVFSTAAKEKRQVSNEVEQFVRDLGVSTENPAERVSAELDVICKDPEVHARTIEHLRRRAVV